MGVSCPVLWNPKLHLFLFVDFVIPFCPRPVTFFPIPVTYFHVFWKKILIFFAGTQLGYIQGVLNRTYSNVPGLNRAYSTVRTQTCGLNRACSTEVYLKSPLE